MLTKKVVEEALETAGVLEVNTHCALAGKLRLSRDTVRKAVAEGNLKPCDRLTYSFDAVVQWMLNRPRFFARVLENLARGR